MVGDPFSMQNEAWSGEEFRSCTFEADNRCPEEKDTSKIVEKIMFRQALIEGLHKGESIISFKFIQCYSQYQYIIKRTLGEGQLKY